MKNNHLKITYNFKYNNLKEENYIKINNKESIIHS